MKLDRPSAIPFQRATLVCRNGKLVGTLGGLLAAAVFAGIGPFWRWADAPWPVWVGFGLLGLFIVPFLLNGIVALYRKENWVLVVEPAGIWINLRSFHNWHFAEADTALFLPYSEIAFIRRHKTRFFVPSSESRSIQQSSSMLEVELNHKETDALARMLQEERRRRAPERRSLIGLKVRSKAKHYPVTLPEANKIHVADAYVVPSLKRVVAELARHVEIGEATRQEFDDWQDLNDEEVDVLVRLLVESGDEMAATKLLRRRRKMSLSEAKRTIEHILSETP